MTPSHPGGHKSSEILAEEAFLRAVTIAHASAMKEDDTSCDVLSKVGDSACSNHKHNCTEHQKKKTFLPWNEHSTSTKGKFNLCWK